MSFKLFLNVVLSVIFIILVLPLAKLWSRLFFSMIKKPADDSCCKCKSDQSNCSDCCGDTGSCWNYSSEENSSSKKSEKSKPKRKSSEKKNSEESDSDD